ncbi:MAG: hypothetical protein B6245_14015 [Desulfobacteraceae bacterium 4572_88]|nr:MAG: hypothetical protein B6245_14015 [Desulfobacteraceae bacterium 4572_88]
MKSRLRIWTILMMIGILPMMSCGFWGSLTPDQKGKIIDAAGDVANKLLSSEEAGQTNLDDMEAKEWRRYRKEYLLASLTRSASPGPRIMMEAPEVSMSNQGQTAEMLSPARLKISFGENPESGESVDMASLDVKAVKWLVSISLTDRLKPYIQGTTLEAEKVEIPKGKFHIEVSVADAKGEKTVENYLFVVK